MRKFGILLTVMAAAIIALPNTVTNDVVVATSDAELRISDRGLGLGLEVVGGGAAEVKLEARPGWRFRDGSTSVTLNKAAGEPAKSPDAVGEGQSAEGSATIVIEDGEDDDDENGDGEGSVEHEKPILSMTATAPKVVAYSVQDGGTNVSISLSATVTTKGRHRKLDAEGNVVEEKEFSPKHYVWKMTGVATGEAETDSSTHTFTVNLTKGESKSLNFSVVGKTCSICDGDVESDEAEDSIEIDVYELSISRPDYLGLDRTDAGRQGHVVKTATLSSDPSLPSSSSVEWKECGICEFVGAKNQWSVSYQNKDSETASGEYLAERLAASVTLAGMDSSVVCSTNFTVVKVDVVLSGVGEDGDETAIPSVYYIVDEDSGSLSKAGLRCLYPVAVACVPADVPGLVGVAIDVGAELYEITESSDGVPTLAVPAQKAYLGCEIGQKRFGIHGHSLIGDAGDEKLMSAVHRLSNAIDHAHVKVASPPPIILSNLILISPSQSGGWPYDPIWDDQDWSLTVNGSKAVECAEDVDQVEVMYNLNIDAMKVDIQMYIDSWGWSNVPVGDTVEGTTFSGKNRVDCWEIIESTDVKSYICKVYAESMHDDSVDLKKTTAEITRDVYYKSDNAFLVMNMEKVGTVSRLEEAGAKIELALTTSVIGTLLRSQGAIFVFSVASSLLPIPDWMQKGTTIYAGFEDIERFEWKTATKKYELGDSISIPGYDASPAQEVRPQFKIVRWEYYAPNTGPDELDPEQRKPVLKCFVSERHYVQDTNPTICGRLWAEPVEWMWAPIPRMGGYGLACPDGYNYP